MEKRVLMIGETSGFMVNAIVNGLKKEDYEVLPVMPNLNEISRLENKPKLWTLYLDAKVLEQDELLIYLRDTAIELEAKLFLIGNKEELEEAHKVMTGVLTKDFERPFNVKQLADELDRAVEKEAMNEMKKSVLIVDDNPTTLHSFKNMLSSKYRVYMANSGINAFTFLGKNQVDLILLDYEMPVANGPQVLEMIRGEPSMADIPVMFLTAKSDKESVLKVVALKPEKYLLKTMPPEELIRNIDDFFKERKRL